MHVLQCFDVVTYQAKLQEMADTLDSRLLGNDMAAHILTALHTLHCRPAAQLQVFMGRNGVRALDLEWRLLLGMGPTGRTIRFPPGIYAIARKAAKVEFYAEEPNTQGTGHRLNPGSLQGPSVTLVTLPSGGHMEPVLAVSLCTLGICICCRQTSACCAACPQDLLSACAKSMAGEYISSEYPMITLAHAQEFEEHTHYPRYFGMTIDVEGLRNRWDGGHCLVPESAYLFLNHTADNVKDKVHPTVLHTLQQSSRAATT
jgi:hypothetical protein